MRFRICVEPQAPRRSRGLALALALLCAAGCPADDYAHLYQADPLAPGHDEASVAALEHLGATLLERGVNFGIYSNRATRVELLLFDDPEAARPTRRVALHRFGDVWNAYVQGVGAGQHYGYVAWGPNWPYDPAWAPGRIDGFVADVDAEGNRFNPNKLLLDPYARGIHRDHDWSQGSNASGPKRTESTWAAASKSVVTKSSYVWSAAEEQWRKDRQREDFAGHGWNELVVYEVHPKGLTASPASGVEHPGTYRGFGELADYFKDLGINAVELLPVHEKPLDGGYWGYQTLLFFAPELSYAFATRPEERIDEFKEMVDALHQRGIEVWLDVVYNHTGEGGFWREKLQLDDTNLDPGTSAQLVNFDPKEVAGIYAYRGIDNAAYYALSPDNQGYWNNTGVGNETRPNHTPMRRLIMDSLRYWVEELHVDGYRFDLAPILGEKDGDYNNWDEVANTVLQEIIDDPVLQRYNTRIVAEPWSAGGHYGVKIGAFPAAKSKPGTGWYEWNGRFRDWWRAFFNFDEWNLSSREGDADGGFLLTGCYDYYQWNGRRPYHTVNFVTVHDGFPMYDLFSYDKKQNKCGPLNPVCCETPMSPFCDLDSGESNNRSRNWGQDNEPFKRQQMRNLFLALMISHGTPMLLGGDEWMRTQLGNNNAYSSGADNAFNWFDWGVWKAQDERHRMFDFVRQAIRLRQEHGYALAPSQYKEGAPLTWKNERNEEPPNWSSKRLMVHYHDASFGPELLILINGENLELGKCLDFTLPTGRKWRRLVDTQAYFDGAEYLEQGGRDKRRSANIELDAPEEAPGPTYCAHGRTIVVLEARP